MNSPSYLSTSRGGPNVSGCGWAGRVVASDGIFCKRILLSGVRDIGSCKLCEQSRKSVAVLPKASDVTDEFLRLGSNHPAQSRVTSHFRHDVRQLAHIF